MTLHLLRSFVQWYRGSEPIKTIGEADEYVREIAGAGWDRFYTWTSRRVTRAAEMKGGSVFFVGGPKRNQALFRMPFVDIEESGGGWAICMEPKLIPVQQLHVGKVRGWRYLKAEDPPKDIPYHLRGVEPIGLPPGLRADLERDGLL